MELTVTICGITWTFDRTADRTFVLGTCSVNSFTMFVRDYFLVFNGKYYWIKFAAVPIDNDWILSYDEPKSFFSASIVLPSKKAIRKASGGEYDYHGRRTNLQKVICKFYNLLGEFLMTQNYKRCSIISTRSLLFEQLTNFCILAKPHTEKTDMEWDEKDQARNQDKSKLYKLV